jgi:hypothetical protein
VFIFLLIFNFIEADTSANDSVKVANAPPEHKPPLFPAGEKCFAV